MDCQYCYSRRCEQGVTTQQWLHAWQSSLLALEVFEVRWGTIMLLPGGSQTVGVLT